MTTPSPQLPSDILELEKKVFSIKVFTHENISDLVKNIYTLEKKHFNNPQDYATLTHITNYVKHQLDLKEAYKSRLLTLVATIFLPLGVITGFFGMNFKSMGAPTLKSGVLNVNHEWVLIGFAILIILIIGFFYLEFGEVF